MGKGLRKIELVALVIAGVGLAMWFAARAGKTPLDPEHTRRLKNPVSLNEQTLQAAKAIYLQKCANCHGESGLGDGPEAMMYDPAPADLSRAHVRQMTDGEVFYQISEGDKPMPPFKSQLTEEQRWQLVHYIRSFAAQPPPTPKP